MSQRINLRILKDLHDFIEKYRIENNLEDICDTIGPLLMKKKKIIIIF